ncbi:hypothetical protein JZY06_01570 [Corynebacterium sp. CCM 8862]|uniref:DUF2613 domain-containing protein n=1 Tax=Corynebacterium mendelii TaxID=2765362 RepID=A0A939IUL5_9CORY|nr:hypothetical protein [Corynebacterium mendelii]
MREDCRPPTGDGRRSKKQHAATVLTGMLVGLCVAVSLIAVNEQQPPSYDRSSASVSQQSGMTHG